MEVNYKNKKSYNTAKYPIRQPRIITWLIFILSKIMLMGQKYEIQKINTQNLKPPYILLSNHHYFVDFELAALATYPHKVNNVVSVDGYYRRPWLMVLIGAICKRKFTNDLHLVKSIRKVLKKGDVFCMYPEARYTPDGTTAILPESIGKLIKMNKVPVACIVHHGNHLRTPFWNYRKARKVPLRTTFTQILTAEQVEELSVDEINNIVRESLTYDEYRYQKENGIKITEPFRAEGLHKILYQCPNCKTEHKMNSKGAEIFCEECGKRWTLTEDGNLQANDGKTEFSHIPDWFAWERSEVRRQIENGSYHFEDKVDVYSLPRCWRFLHLGDATLTHDINDGFTITGHYRGKDYKIERKPLGQIGLHIEYDYCYIKPFDCVDISTDKDSFYCFPTKQNVVTKLSFATEEIYRLKQLETKKEKQKS